MNQHHPTHPQQGASASSASALASPISSISKKRDRNQVGSFGSGRVGTAGHPGGGGLPTLPLPSHPSTSSSLFPLEFGGGGGGGAVAVPPPIPTQGDAMMSDEEEEGDGFSPSPYNAEEEDDAAPPLVAFAPAGSSVNPFAAKQKGPRVLRAQKRTCRNAPGGILPGRPDWPQQGESYAFRQQQQKQHQQHPQHFLRGGHGGLGGAGSVFQGGGFAIPGFGQPSSSSASSAFPSLYPPPRPIWGVRPSGALTASAPAAVHVNSSGFEQGLMADEGSPGLTFSSFNQTLGVGQGMGLDYSAVSAPPGGAGYGLAETEFEMDVGMEVSESHQKGPTGSSLPVSGSASQAGSPVRLKSRGGGLTVAGRRLLKEYAQLLRRCGIGPGRAERGGVGSAGSVCGGGGGIGSPAPSASSAVSLGSSASASASSNVNMNAAFGQSSSHQPMTMMRGGPPSPSASSARMTRGGGGSVGGGNLGGWVGGSAPFPSGPGPAFGSGGGQCASSGPLTAATSVELVDESIFDWRVVLPVQRGGGGEAMKTLEVGGGRNDGGTSVGRTELLLSFPQDYPANPPSVRIVKVFQAPSASSSSSSSGAAAEGRGIPHPHSDGGMHTRGGAVGNSEESGGSGSQTGASSAVPRAGGLSSRRTGEIDLGPLGWNPSMSVEALLVSLCSAIQGGQADGETRSQQHTHLAGGHGQTTAGNSSNPSIPQPTQEQHLQGAGVSAHHGAMVRASAPSSSSSSSSPTASGEGAGVVPSLFSSTALFQAPSNSTFVVHPHHQGQGGEGVFGGGQFGGLGFAFGGGGGGWVGGQASAGGDLQGNAASFGLQGSVCQAGAIWGMSVPGGLGVVGGMEVEGDDGGDGDAVFGGGG
uniref:Uncharacterized protein n=1 Tax=Chromera velia CCMP2878 TaxID=1169474 RepID=A0A0G4HS17_9ALVE|eukprot:Cvel_8158.t1-p1 / transcript=Cvel_8158.t1 / gene=Cvel_8158 / organism=Chromera_velia_CCMP2878 / gene_product=hypothetical protein / transcript_product=hypothetical protein / location=Cvel_scaffold444:29058-32755(+) / protein_length=865 / sequence_SO=supercontig / SO=protein_coding / is_pseudo=false